MNILGISCWYHDAAACLVQDGRIVAAAQEERFTRRKHDAGFPRHAIAYCLRQAGLTTRDLDVVAFYDKPFLKFERLLETYVATAPKGLRSFIKAMPLWLKQKLWIPDLLAKELDYDGPLVFPEHHESHAASAFFPSPFERAAFLTTDGVGEWATTSYGTGEGNRLRILAEIHFPHSLGLLYSAFTYFCGFKVNSGEYKLMGLAPYGEPRYVDAIRSELIDVKEDGSFRLNMDYFTYAHGLRMTGRRFARLFGGPRRPPEGPLTRREMDLARSVQVVTEEVLLRMARHVHRATGLPDLCLAGGVALNCVANGRILREGPFERLWIQPAAGDAGGALGAALMAWHDYLGRERTPAAPDAMQGAYLGPAFSDDAITAFLEREGIPHEHLPDEDALVRRTAGLLAAGKVVGWFQGRMEFGPRALGNRSILADPRGRDVQRTVNLKIKFRESFRPFAPSVLADRAADYFDLDVPSPYMLLVAPVKGARIEGEGLERLRHIDAPLPAVTHVDGSARIQTVDDATNPRFARLLRAFEAETGCPVLVNTSFNVRGEPIVCTPEDAYRCFRRTHMDALVMGTYLVTRTMLPDAEAAVWTPEEVAATYGLD
ncbi:MAG: carbamoyltransferase [Rhodothermaceae bacterium]|nr:MAG: carbamoyltransferase [Rhodothermaceae bacterium]